MESLKLKSRTRVRIRIGIRIRIRMKIRMRIRMRMKIRKRMKIRMRIRFRRWQEVDSIFLKLHKNADIFQSFTEHFHYFLISYIFKMK